MKNTSTGILYIPFSPRLSNPEEKNFIIKLFLLNRAYYIVTTAAEGSKMGIIKVVQNTSDTLYCDASNTAKTNESITRIGTAIPVNSKIQKWYTGTLS